MHDVSSHTALMLFTQLLEALAHLLQNEVAHRDLKTDNILIDLSYGNVFHVYIVRGYYMGFRSLIVTSNFSVQNILFDFKNMIHPLVPCVCIVIECHGFFLITFL